jgi:aspartate carbamoyltransferase catalytic subunit
MAIEYGLGEAARFSEAGLDNGFENRDFLSVEQLTAESLKALHDEANLMSRLTAQTGTYSLLGGSVHNLLFWDSSSTRTKGSFDHAIERLGGLAKPFHQESSSKQKGETFEDTVEMLDAYMVPGRDTLIVRHNVEGSVRRAAEIADVQVINAGDGTGEHPTQALLDTKTIRDTVNRLDESMIVFHGDLAHARTVNSTAPLLAIMGVKRMAFVAPADELRLSANIVQKLQAEGVEVSEYDDIREIAPQADIIYAVRTQYEFMDDPEAARARFTGKCLLTTEKLEGSGAKIMHPLPEDRQDLNIDAALRQDPRWIGKEQARQGMYTRMALLALMAGKSLGRGHHPHLSAV